MQYSKYEMPEGSYPKPPFKPHLEREHTVEQVEQYAKNLVVYEREKIVWEEERSKYHKKENLLREQFEKDALEEVGLTDHPKASRIFAYAYAEGHSDGYGDIFSVLSDIADLFLDD